jgi:hypothetical protein
MKSHRSLRYTIMWTARPPGRHRREPAPGVARTQATRGIVVPALVLASLGAAAGVVAGQSAGGNVHATAHQSAMSVAPTLNTVWTY